MRTEEIDRASTFFSREKVEMKARRRRGMRGWDEIEIAAQMESTEAN
jgi:hypothetical protein